MFPEDGRDRTNIMDNKSVKLLTKVLDNVLKKYLDNDNYIKDDLTELCEDENISVEEIFINMGIPIWRSR